MAEALANEETAIRHLMERLLIGRPPSIETLSRLLHVTPFEGNYGRAGYVIAINGSPPRGMIVTEGDLPFFIGGGKARAIHNQDSRQVVWDFIAWYERGAPDLAT